MLNKIKLKNSTVLFIGIILIIIGIFSGSLEYFNEKKNKAFSDMNILLYESETPENINLEEEFSSSINTEEEVEISHSEGNQDTQYNFKGILEIPKINLKRGFLDLNSYYNNVDYNITVIKGSTYPDEEKNNLILVAHSGICSVCYFEGLYNLQKGDKAYITYKNIKYTYKIVSIYDVEKTGRVAIYRDHNKNTLTLITCTRNSNTKQTVYILELIDKK